MRVLIAWLCLLFGFSLAVNEPCRGPSTVIAGGGVIGLSTAWYLAVLQHQTNVSSCIYIVDSSSELLAGASGHATGVLHFDDFKEETRSLSRLSWSEHQALAAEHNGRARYGFSSLTAYNITIFEEGSQTSINDGADVQLPRWFKNSDRYAVEAERFNTAAAILDPFRFGQWLVQECKHKGVRILLNATVTSIKAAESQSLSTVAVLSLFDQPSIEIKNLVIAAGPWSGRVLKTLFPAAQIQISLDTLSSSSNHLTVRSPRWRPSDDSAGCHQLFLDKVLSRPLDISSHLNGTLYIGSYGAEPEELPALATEVKPQQGAIDHIKQLCRRMLDLPEEEDLEIVQPGRCYRPVVKQGRPIIAEVPLALLCDPSESSLPYRVFLNVGHGSYGITLGLGSGKVMSQLIMGVKPSANISGLGYK